MHCLWVRCPQCKSEAYWTFGTTEDAEECRRSFGGKVDGEGALLLKECHSCGLGGIKRSIDIGGYFNRELPGITDKWPQMGHVCDHCKMRIPHFLDLTAEVAKKASASDTSVVQAIRLVHEATGCSISWGELWVRHAQGLCKPFQWPGPPCAYCGEPLRSKLAKQCLECGMDWHDPDNARRLG